MTAHVNGTLLRRRRIDAALGVTHAATILGVGAPTLSRIESGDTSAVRAISVGSLLDLADALGCTPADLFEKPPPTTPAPAHSSTVDPELLIGVLAESPNQVSIKDLAATFDATNSDIHVAAEQAHARLSGTGLRLGRRHDRLFFAPTQQAAVTDLLTTLECTTTARTGIDNGTARILRQVLAGQLRNGRRSHYTQSALAMLTRLGILTTTDQGPVPSDAVKYALDVP